MTWIYSKLHWEALSDVTMAERRQLKHSFKFSWLAKRQLHSLRSETVNTQHLTLYFTISLKVTIAEAKKAKGWTCLKLMIEWCWWGVGTLVQREWFTRGGHKQIQAILTDMKSSGLSTFSSSFHQNNATFHLQHIPCYKSRSHCNALLWHTVQQVGSHFGWSLSLPCVIK